MTKLERAVARYIKALDRREYILTRDNQAYANACNVATAASIALGELDPEVRGATYQAWKAKNHGR